MEWHYSKNGQQHGPVNEAELIAMVQNGSVAPTDLAWNKGMDGWKPIREITALTVQSVNVVPASGQASPYQASASSQGAVNTPVPSYLWQSIVVTLFCCLPLGVVAIVYASKVDALSKAGDSAGASAASDSAKTWCWVSFGIGLVVNIILIIIGASEE
jgi:hypothetical protein